MWQLLYYCRSWHILLYYEGPQNPENFDVLQCHGELYPFFGHLAVSRSSPSRATCGTNSSGILAIASFPFWQKKISHHVVEVLLVPIFVYRANWKATKIIIVFLTFLYYCSLCVGALRFIGPSLSLVSMLDEFSQVLRTLPLRNKLETSPTLLRFYTYVLTQFHVPIKCINVTTVLAKLQSSYLSQD